MMPSYPDSDDDVNETVVNPRHSRISEPRAEPMKSSSTPTRKYNDFEEDVRDKFLYMDQSIKTSFPFLTLVGYVTHPSKYTISVNDTTNDLINIEIDVGVSNSWAQVTVTTRTRDSFNPIARKTTTCSTREECVAFVSKKLGYSNTVLESNAYDMLKSLERTCDKLLISMN
jgi:hypothetical protein